MNVSYADLIAIAVKLFECFRYLYNSPAEN